MISHGGYGTGAAPRRARTAATSAVTAIAALLLVAGCSAPGEEPPPQSAPANRQPVQGDTQARDEQPAQDAEKGTGSGQQDAAALPKSPPRRISIPSLGVSSALEELGQQKDGAMETPVDPAKAGWYVPGPPPGAQGPAVIAGHVSWNGEPSVFHRLSSLKAGDRIEVDRADGKTAQFTVDRTAQYPKNRFPTVEVYKNIDHAGLRLITCGGQYDRSTRYYSDNVVVFASLTGSR
ncbi:class F sortase [Streptomyces flavidovirens]|uniref:class F sortase n=1 Tax=Streptomyces flavidovirens TaxID=67298 RepID=UPI0036C44626